LCEMRGLDALYYIERCTWCMQIINPVVRHMHKYAHVDLGPVSHVFSILLCLVLLLLPESPEGVGGVVRG
jgi:hypothetical protein